jgi:hypothetical protein
MSDADLEQVSHGQRKKSLGIQADRPRFVKLDSSSFSNRVAVAAGQEEKEGPMRMNNESNSSLLAASLLVSSFEDVC